MANLYHIDFERMLRPTTNIWGTLIKCETDNGVAPLRMVQAMRSDPRAVIGAPYQSFMIILDAAHRIHPVSHIQFRWLSQDGHEYATFNPVIDLAYTAMRWVYWCLSTAARDKHRGEPDAMQFTELEALLDRVLDILTEAPDGTYPREASPVIIDATRAYCRARTLIGTVESEHTPDTQTQQTLVCACRLPSCYACSDLMHAEAELGAILRMHKEELPPALAEALRQTAGECLLFAAVSCAMHASTIRDMAVHAWANEQLSGVPKNRHPAVDAARGIYAGLFGAMNMRGAHGKSAASFLAPRAPGLRERAPGAVLQLEGPCTVCLTVRSGTGTH